MEINSKTVQTYIGVIEECYVDAGGQIKVMLDLLKKRDLQLSATSFYRLLKPIGFFERDAVQRIQQRAKFLKEIITALNPAEKTIEEILDAVNSKGYALNKWDIYSYLSRWGLKYKKKDLSKKVYLNLNRERRAPRGAEEITLFVQSKGWQLVEIIDTKGVDKSVNGKLLLLKCPNGHEKRTALTRFWQKQNCLSCVKESKRLQYEKTVEEHFSSHGMTFLETSGSDVVASCPQGHTFSVLFNNFKKNNSCPECYFERNGFSLAENEIVQFIKTLYSGDIKVRDRSLISPLELDIYLPELKLAIEYNGLYFHSFHPNRRLIDKRCKFLSESDARTYHRKKLDLCQSKGVRLISIFEDEWHWKKTICKSKIQNLLGQSQKKYARKLSLRELTSKETKNFMNENHLQGYRGGYTLGLVCDDVVYSAATFSLPIRRHTASQGTVEISRFASLCGFNIVGGFSKILKAARAWAKSQGYSKIKTHCDLRWGTGGVYLQSGFTKIGETKYTPHYVKSLRRYRNQSLRKTAEEKKTRKTERTLRFEQGYSVIYDCGHSAWEMAL